MCPRRSPQRPEGCTGCPEVELEAFVSHLMDTGNGMPVLSVRTISMFSFIREQWFKPQTSNKVGF